MREPQSRSGNGGEEKNFQSPKGIRTVEPRSLVHISSELSLLLSIILCAVANIKMEMSLTRWFSDTHQHQTSCGKVLMAVVPLIVIPESST
jgi:hypothetical protein